LSRHFHSRKSRDDLSGIADYHSDRDLDFALSLLGAIEAECRKLAEMPGLGRPRPEREGLRSWRVGRTKYLIFYRPVEGGIEIVRVVHGSRDLGPLLDDG
jgi:toxin ParE1/3/4